MRHFAIARNLCNRTGSVEGVCVFQNPRRGMFDSTANPEFVLRKHEDWQQQDKPNRRSIPAIPVLIDEYMGEGFFDYILPMSLKNIAGLITYGTTALTVSGYPKTHGEIIMRELANQDPNLLGVMLPNNSPEGILPRDELDLKVGRLTVSELSIIVELL